MPACNAAAGAGRWALHVQEATPLTIVAPDIQVGVGTYVPCYSSLHQVTEFESRCIFDPNGIRTWVTCAEMSNMLPVLLPSGQR